MLGFAAATAAISASPLPSRIEVRPVVELAFAVVAEDDRDVRAAAAAAAAVGSAPLSKTTVLPSAAARAVMLSSGAVGVQRDAAVPWPRRRSLR